MLGYNNNAVPSVTHSTKVAIYSTLDKHKKNKTRRWDSEAPQSTHRVAMAVFWRIFHHGGKICPGW
jgi:hypothetical protein